MWWWWWGGSSTESNLCLWTFVDKRIHHRIAGQKESARVLRLSSTLDQDFKINTTNLYDLLAGGRKQVTANVYGADISKVGLSLTSLCQSISLSSLFR